MNSIAVNLGPKSYNVEVESGLIESVGNKIASLGLGKKCVLVTDTHVDTLYGDKVFSSLDNAGYDVKKTVVPEGEEAKSSIWLAKLWDVFLSHGMDRSGFVVALGGGVPGDLAGFAAATFMRGIQFIQVPTTLLAQVDASVGGKTGINLPQGKNLAGAFHQPRSVLIDPEVLKTLDQKDFLSGFAEVIKYGVISDKKLFEFLENNLNKILLQDSSAIAKIISDSCSIKAHVVSKDETEQGLRAILNYGHTIGHALETCGKYTQLTHGQAVALDMVAAGRLAALMKSSKREDAERIENLIANAALPMKVDNLDAEMVMQYIKFDKKRHRGSIRFVLLERIGTVYLEDNINEALLFDAIASLA